LHQQQLPELAPGDVFNPFGLFYGAWIPEAILRSTDITPSEKLVAARLFRYAGKGGVAFPSVEELAREVGLSLRQVKYCLTSLQEKHKLIRRTGKGGRSMVNRIEFLWNEIYTRKGQRPLPKSVQSAAQFLTEKGAVNGQKPCNIRSQTVQPIAHAYKELESQEENHEESHSEKTESEKPRPSESEWEQLTADG
jgi:hypothetical protein